MKEKHPAAAVATLKPPTFYNSTICWKNDSFSDKYYIMLNNLSSVFGQIAVTAPLFLNNK